jgi:signal transduction histidine kinase
MSQMVETLLILAREDETTEEEVSKVSLVAQTIIADNRHLLKEKPITLDVQNKQDFPLQAPQSILIILLGNILRNAIAYTKKGSIIVIVEAPFVMITDTGTGISTEQLPLIFERHYRATSDASDGSGIGLAIVKRICDRYGWRIDVTSATGEGTKVTIDFSESMV